MTRAPYLFSASLAAFVTALLAIAFFQAVTGSGSYSGSEPTSRSRAEIEVACNEHIRAAEARAMAAVERRAEGFRQFVEERKQGAGDFAEDLVSWEGRWRAVKARLPGTDPDGHHKYVAQKFGEHVFTETELASRASSVIEDSIREVDAIENELAVALRQEILGRSLAPDERPLALREFEVAVQKIVEASQWDAAKAAGSLVVSEVAAQVAGQVLLRLGVSSGLLVSGAAASWWTIGGSFLIGLVADALWQWIDDPAGDIEFETRAALDRLAADASEAFRTELQQLVLQRRKLWKGAVEEMLR